MTPARTISLTGRFLAALGILIFVLGIVLHWAYPERFSLELVPITGGAVLGWVGFYLINPKGAETGGVFLVDSAVKILTVVRTGRRATDPVVAVPVVPADKPVPPVVPPRPPVVDPDPDKP